MTSTPAPFRDFHDTAYQIFEASRQPENALAHLAAFKRIDDQGRDVAAKANFALMNAEFENAGKELQIQKLRADKLQKEAALAGAAKQQDRLILLGLALLAAVLIGFLLFAYRSARKETYLVANFNRELEDKNETLSETNTALEKANQAKLEFLAVTSHEIRTPLNAIIGLSDVVISGGAIIDRDREYLEMVNSAGKHLLSVVNDILDVSKLEAGRLVIEDAPLNVGVEVTDVANIWRKSATEKGLDFNIDVAEESTEFLSDSRLIRQIVSNLLSNAVKFTSEGSVGVQYHADPAYGFTIKVTDTGIGVAPEKQAEIFEAFKQADGRLQRAYGGTGLGLAIIKKIANAMGGDISLQSELEKGSTFTVTIPAKIVSKTVEKKSTEQEAAPATTIARNTVESLDKINVLVAEDNVTNAMVISAYLKNDVAKLDIVENGALAVEAVKTGNYHLVLMDKQMPVMDGILATKTIRELSEDVRDIPIIAVTADAFEGAREMILESGMDGFVSKPLDGEKLKSAMLDVLAERKQRAA